VDSAEARRILQGYGSADPSKILDALDEVAGAVRTGPVKEYLSKKIASARKDPTREACAPLRPYLEWYVQGSE